MIRRTRIATAVALVVASVAFTVIGDSPAYADHHAPPGFPSTCPKGQAPPPGYPNPPPKTPWLYTGKTYADWSIYTGHTYSGPIAYQVPFKGVIGGTVSQGGNPVNVGGSVVVPAHGNAPELEIPNLFAAVCGLVQLPQLSGTIDASGINLATPNIYIAKLEALPVNVNFGTLHASISLTPAHNGGLDITLTGSTTASVSTLGMTCSVVLNAEFSTNTPGNLPGKPVTGPTMGGQAEVASNSFGVPTVVGSNTGLCPPSIAQTFNKLLGLPLAPGVGTFIAPFCFDFELEGPNNPNTVPRPNHNCPWPK